MKTVVINSSMIHVHDFYFQHLSAISKNQHLKVACTVQLATFCMLSMHFTCTILMHGVR